MTEKNSIMTAFEEAMFKMHKEKVLKEECNKIEHELRLKLIEIEHNKTVDLIEIKRESRTEIKTFKNRIK